MPPFEKCIHSRVVDYKKNEIIIEAGVPTENFGILLEGSAQSIKWDASGRQVIITLIGQGGAIGVLLAASGGQVSPLAVQATSDAKVLMLSFSRLLVSCEKKCPHHDELLRSYIALLAAKGLELHERINCLLEPTVREKILTYLRKAARDADVDSSTAISVASSSEANDLCGNNRTFILPINRNIMAEYLNVERSALSRELSRMKRDGLIDYHKNTFRLLM